jgi:hypothetical protein
MIAVRIAASEIKPSLGSHLTVARKINEYEIVRVAIAEYLV